MRVYFSAVCLALLLPVSAMAQLSDFCAPDDCPPNSDCCVPDVMKVRHGTFDAIGDFAKEANAGDTVNVVVSVDVVSDGIQGWSWAVKHDTNVLTVSEVAFEGANWQDVESGGFNVTVIAFGGADRDQANSGLGQAVVLSLLEDRRLPVMTDLTLASGTYTVANAVATGESSAIEFVDGELATASGGPPVDVNLTIAGSTSIPSQVGNAAVLGPAPAAECDVGYGIFFGSDVAANADVASGDMLVTMRNAADASAFQVAVKNDGGSLSFVDGEIGNQQLLDNLITLADGSEQADLSHNTASVGDTISAVGRAGATSEGVTDDFFVSELSPDQGVGFFAAFVADFTKAQERVIPATSTDEACPVNEILTVSLGGVVAATFVRGDVNADAKFNVTDAVLTIRKTFGLPQPGIDCDAAYDANNNNGIALDDAIFLLNYIFMKGGGRPDDPFPSCGPDPDGETMDCNETCE